MTDKTKMSNLESYVELSIQIATLDMKLNKILELLNKPEIETQTLESTTDYDQTKPYGFTHENIK